MRSLTNFDDDKEEKDGKEKLDRGVKIACHFCREINNPIRGKKVGRCRKCKKIIEVNEE